jgi:hypothetical protein
VVLNHFDPPIDLFVPRSAACQRQAPSFLGKSVAALKISGDCVLNRNLESGSVLAFPDITTGGRSV